MNRSGCHLEYGSCLTRLHSLEGLVARQCPLIGDSAIIDLINNATSLSSLDLQVCSILFFCSLSFISFILISGFY